MSPLKPWLRIRKERAWRDGLQIQETTNAIGSKAESGHSLRFGRLRLYSAPLEFFFQPPRSGLTHVVTVNAEIFALAHEDERLGRILCETLNTIDGRVLQGICKLLYAKHKIIRQNGSGFIYNLAGHCLTHSQRLFLLGSHEKANLLAQQGLRNAFPNLQVSGFSPAFQGYPFDRDWNEGILKRIDVFRPQHLVVCFGPKKQEYWIHQNRANLMELGVRCAYGLGGTVDFVSGSKPRAPKWIEFIGAEWLFRLACEPRARFRRTLIMFKMPFYAVTTTPEIQPLDDILF